MPSNYKVDVKVLRAGLKNPKVLVRVVLGVLLLANLVAAAIVFKPWSGSLEELEREAAGLRKQVHDQQAALDRLRTVVNKVQAARTDGDKFLDSYLLSRRTAASNLLGEMEAIARRASIRQAETQIQIEPIEGSNDLSKATISVNYQGTYADLMHLLNLMDRSPRFLVVESLRAAPQQSSQVLNIAMKVDAFVREGGPDQQVETGEQAPAAPPKPAAQAQAAPAAAPAPAKPKPQAQAAATAPAKPKSQAQAQAAPVSAAPQPAATRPSPGRGFAPAEGAAATPPATVTAQPAAPSKAARGFAPVAPPAGTVLNPPPPRSRKQVIR